MIQEYTFNSNVLVISFLLGYSFCHLNSKSLDYELCLPRSVHFLNIVLPTSIRYGIIFLKRSFILLVFISSVFTLSTWKFSANVNSSKAPCKFCHGKAPGTFTADFILILDILLPHTWYLVLYLTVSKSLIWQFSSRGQIHTKHILRLTHNVKRFCKLESCRLQR